MKFLFEASRTPIYQRIIDGLSTALRQTGHVVLQINPGSYAAVGDYLRDIETSGADYCVLTNPLSPLAQLQLDGTRFLFEFTGRKMILIHHDSIAATEFSDPASIRKRNIALQRTAQRCVHFCIEVSNCLDLQALGVNNVHRITHASEFSRQSVAGSFRHDVSYIGHVMPPGGDIYSGKPFITEAFWKRVARQDEKLDPAATAYADLLYPSARHSPDWFAAKHVHTSTLHEFSQYFRGEVIARLSDIPLDIHGGDPGYLNGIPRNRVIEKPGVRYHDPTRSYAEAAGIYAASKINLNITSLQFDDAVINRVIDVAAAGGFVLTDWKSDLRNLTTVHGQIAYHTVDELNEKIEYYLVNDKERREVAEQLHQDVVRTCRYRNIAEHILDRVS